MSDLVAPFEPDWASPPGDTILDLLEEFGWTQEEFARRICYSLEHTNRLISGDAPITEDAALRLSSVLGSNEEFWLKREAQYRDDLARLTPRDRVAGISS